MKKSVRLLPGIGAMLLASSIFAGNIEIEDIVYRGPIEIRNVWHLDSIDVNNNPFSQNSILKSPINYQLLPKSKGDSVMTFNSNQPEIHFLSFPLNNDRFAEVEINVEGIKDYKIYLDNKETDGNLNLKPGTREVAVKFLTNAGDNDTVKISATSPKSNAFNTKSLQGKRAYTLEDVIYAYHLTDIKVSPSGNFAILSTSKTKPDNTTSYNKKLINLKNGKSLNSLSDDSEWLYNQDKIRFVRDEIDGSRSIIALDPLSMEETVLAENIPDGDFVISPDNNYLIYITNTEGRKEDKDIYQIVNPEDRQPGYRTRYGLAHYDLKKGTYQPLTFGNKNVSLQDISPDGKKLLVMSMRNRFQKRPTTLFSLYELSLENMKVDTLVSEDGFISGASYSPDGMKIAIVGSPESLDGIGKNVPEGRIPNMTDNQIFIMDIASRDIDPITKNFNPAIENIQWNPAFGNLYFTAEDKDKVSLFEYNPKTGKISNMELPEDIVKNFSFANNVLQGAFIGESAINPEILYAIDFKKGKTDIRLLQKTGEKMLAEAALAEVVNWDFVNSVGDTINGRFYLPPNFDPSKKYPMIVNYYGGCSPTSRNFATRYPHHLYANQGYVVYVINPSGATGFGQEFSSRHVNTAGEGVARDIIEGTKNFVEEHPYVDAEKIGCIGASYGGFMTQYLQTVTDLFAAAISHAGISDHTSYWGNGYWGYSYSEVSMADSYPWADKELFVNQSPLYNAEKINTPILFLHGDVDTNVPPMESVQMFTALKLLDKDTALVEVTDQNHHILEPEKRKKWQDTIFAWFAKYLQDDPSWWNNLYPSTPY